MRIAHCSDIHLLSLKGVRWLDWASKRWIGGLNLLTSRSRHYDARVFEAMVEDFNRTGVDHVVCTGDVTNVALEPEFRFAFDFFERIQIGPSEVTVIPGNHDAYVARGGELFSRIFAAYHRGDDDWQWEDEDPWPVVRVRNGVAIIGLSTSLQTPWFTAWGRIGTKQLERLRRVLCDPRLAGHYRLVLLHHPAAGRRARRRSRGLRDWRAFGDLLAEVGADLVLHGHEHLDMAEAVSGPDDAIIHVLGVPSGTYVGAPASRQARYRVLEIEPRQGVPALTRSWLRAWDSHAEGFVDDRPAVAEALEAREPAGLSR